MDEFISLGTLESLDTKDLCDLVEHRTRRLRERYPTIPEDLAGARRCALDAINLALALTEVLGRTVQRTEK